MTDPIKATSPIAPESHSPKRPEILKLAEQIDTSRMDKILKNHAVEMLGIEYIHLPPLRFIGMDVKPTRKNAGNLWAKADEFMPLLDTSDHCAAIIDVPCGFMHQEDMESGKGTKYHYLAGRFMNACTPVPEGFGYRDVPESDAAIATFYGEFNDMIRQVYVLTRDRIMRDGRGIPYPVGYFYAELYTKECIPNPGAVSKMSYLFSCKTSEVK